MRTARRRQKAWERGYNFLGYTRRASAAQLRINIHTRSRVISIAHPVLTIPYVWRVTVTHEYINEGLKQGLKKFF